MNAKRGQGTIEYLVIIAIVIVIALVVVGLLLQIMGQNSGATETASKAAWKSAQPWGIVDWSATGGTLTLVLQNNTAETMDLNQVRITGLTLTAGDNQSKVAPGSKIATNVTMTGTGCTSGNKYSLPKSTIFIDYNSASIAGKTQAAVADITGTC